MKNWLAGTVEKIVCRNSRLYSLFVSAPTIDFKAGQFTFLGNEIDGQRIFRPYSFVNSPDDSTLEFYFNKVENGVFTTYLTSLTTGDHVRVSPKVSGLMTLDEIRGADNLWLIATGTGVGPYISILKTNEVWERFNQVILVYGVREKNDLAFLEEIQTFTKKSKQNFTAIFCTSREDTNSTAYGRIQNVFKSGELEEIASLTITKERSHVMLCGNSGMIKEMLELLSARGLKKNRRSEPGNITLEKYW